MGKPAIAIIDYGSGNLHSAQKAFEHEAEKLGGNVKLVNHADSLDDASHIVLPGVGAFADCMSGLCTIPNIMPTLEHEVHIKGKPFLGICVGMQLLAETGQEHGEHEGLNWIPGTVTALSPPDNSYKIPHMGWNELHWKTNHPLLDGLEQGAHAYFVHSYHMECRDINHCVATTDYGHDITAMVAHENIMGTQFHPEKSHTTGLKLIGNFLRIT